MKLDFSPPKEAPEEFRALTFSAPPLVKGQAKPALLASQIYHQGIPPLPADCAAQVSSRLLFEVIFNGFKVVGGACMYAMFTVVCTAVTHVGM